MAGPLSYANSKPNENSLILGYRSVEMNVWGT